MKEVPKGERPSGFALSGDISIRVHMNLADRLKARGTNESRTGAISVTEARCARTRVCVQYVRAVFEARAHVCRAG